MEYDIKFPQMPDNIGNPGVMALYHAHCDFMPFKSVIETTKASVMALSEFYHKQTLAAREHNDFITEEWAMTSGMVYSARAVPLSYQSLVLIMISLLEEAFNTLCRTHYLINKYKIKQKDIAGQGIERAITYLEIVANVQGIKSDPEWEYVRAIRDARNMIVHNGGRVNDSKLEKTFAKFGFYIREEDKMLMFEHDDIVRMYNAIMEFIGRTFVIEPKTE